MSELFVAMYPLAVENGIQATEYWNMTYDEILVQVAANQKKEEKVARERAAYDYRMVQLMAYAVNDPQKMPKAGEFYPMLQEETEELTDEQKAMIEMKKEQEQLMMIAEQIKATRQRKNT